METKKYTKAPIETWQTLQLNAGIIVDDFDPDTGEYGHILGATDGGAKFDAKPNFVDRGEGIDNIPPDTAELKDIENWTITLAGTYKNVTKNMLLDQLVAADVDPEDDRHITLRNFLKMADFKVKWWVGDYSNRGGGFIAIKLMRTIEGNGFSMQSQNRDKSSIPFNYTAHYSLNNITEVPCEIWIDSGEPVLEELTVTSAAGSTTGKTALTVTPEKETGHSYKYKTHATTAPSVAYGDSVTSWDSWNGSAEITATNGHKITVVEADDNGKAVKAGSTTITAATE